MENKLTDNEIIKALECCQTNKCDECPIYKECHTTEKGRVDVVLDLINRQKAEIDGLCKTLYKQILENHSLKAEIAHKNAIIEAVLDTVHDLGDDLARALENPNKTNGVKHSKWKINCDGYYPYCPECGAEPKGGIMTKFCAECGAQMEGCVM